MRRSKYKLEKYWQSESVYQHWVRVYYTQWWTIQVDEPGKMVAFAVNFLSYFQSSYRNNCFQSKHLIRMQYKYNEITRHSTHSVSASFAISHWLTLCAPHTIPPDAFLYSIENLSSNLLKIVWRSLCSTRVKCVV